MILGLGVALSFDKISQVLTDYPQHRVKVSMYVKVVFPQDMVDSDIPDKFSIITYVSQFYHLLKVCGC